MKLCLLLCEDFDGILSAEHAPYGDLFHGLFKQACAEPIQWQCVDVRTQPLPEPDKSIKYVITGSRASAYDQTPWVLALGDFVRAAFARRAKLVGICFGHQLIAEALGGKVARADVGWGSSIRRSPIIDNDIARRWGREAFTLEYNHHDQVTRLPEDARAFCGSDFCPYEGFYIPERVLTFQGHPEFTPDYASVLFDFFKGEIAPAERARHQAHAHDNTDAHAVARWILDF